MKVTSFVIQNYRTLEDITLNFSSSYTAICGANDCGKTNVIRAIRSLVKEDGSSPYTLFYTNEELSLKDDFPKWKETDHQKREISFTISITLDNKRDVGFFQFVVTQLKISNPPNPLSITIAVTHGAERSTPKVIVSIQGKEYSDLPAQEVLKKLQSSDSIIFHNSTGIDSRRFAGRSVGGIIREITSQDLSLMDKMKATVSNGLKRISKSKQTEFESLLGRLQTKYKVGLSVPTLDFDYLPFSITLGDKKLEVPLDDWGSGTKNRTLVLLALFRAKQIAESESSAGKITPVIIVEEPESFLHPSAQAEFGRVLQDLAEEFGVQVIATTHSPYLLNLKHSGSNILLNRNSAYRQQRDTKCVDTTGENWTAPFSQALGLNVDELKPWKGLMLSGSDAILLVEGETDKEYFELLRDPKHGVNKLNIGGDIVSYEGTGSLSNTVLLRFVKNRFQKMFVTYDLDSASRVEKVLLSLDLEKNKNFCPIGLAVAGKRNIEGLLPDSITTAVYGANSALVQAATAGSKEEQDSAKNKLKKLLLEEFKRKATPGPDFFSHFYALTKVINKAIA